MKTLPLRELLRRPGEVKKITARGQAVTITDHGDPLWVIHPAAAGAPVDAERDAAIERELDALLAEKQRGVSLAKVVLDSRA
jgi:antitoxin (DNA-binding transcriptional repressor) of toxin-antitoxin stability system